MIKNKIEAEGLSRSKSTGILTVSRCISGPNLVILAWTGDKLLYRQVWNGINLDLQVRFKIIYKLKLRLSTAEIKIIYRNRLWDVAIHPCPCTDSQLAVSKVGHWWVNWI